MIELRVERDKERERAKEEERDKRQRVRLRAHLIEVNLTARLLRVSLPAETLTSAIYRLYIVCVLIYSLYMCLHRSRTNLSGRQAGKL